MNEINRALDKAYNISMAPYFVQRAVYNHSMDCIEYVCADTITITKRVDDFLTLIYDVENRALIGFKIKGFKHFFEKDIKPKYPDIEFLPLVNVLEEIISMLGNGVSKEYQEAKSIAVRDNLGFDLADMAA